jgi:hypothetical protein
MICISDLDIYLALARRILVDFWLLALHVAARGWDLIDEHYLDGLLWAWRDTARCMGVS